MKKDPRKKFRQAFALLLCGIVFLSQIAGILAQTQEPQLEQERSLGQESDQNSEEKTNEESGGEKSAAPEREKEKTGEQAAGSEEPF